MKDKEAESSESIKNEMEALRERLRQSTLAMNSSTKQEGSHELMSIMIKSTATFERN